MSGSSQVDARPIDHVNPTPAGRYNLVVIGAGRAGVACASGAAELGARVALVERHALGGANLHTGSLPLQVMIGAAQAAHLLRYGNDWGVNVSRADVDFGAVMERVRLLQTQLTARNSVASLQDKGIDVYWGAGRFIDATSIEVEGQKLAFAKAVIATGARSALQAIHGLAEFEPLTYETIFSLRKLPRRLAVIGAGGHGVEMAQVFARLGSAVTVFDSDMRLVSHADAEASAHLQAALLHDGVTLRLGARSLRGELRGGEKVQLCDCAEGTYEDFFDEVLAVKDYLPNIEGLNLEGAGVECDRRGIVVNDYLRTTSRRIFACGDVCSSSKSAHSADAQARIVIANALFFGSDRVSHLNIPEVIRTNPEIAFVGMSEQEARSAGHEIMRLELEHEEGFIKLSHDRRGQISGATIVSSQASEVIGEIVMAMNHKVSLSRTASDIHPTPTHSELLKRCGDAFRRTMLTPTVTKLLKRILSWQR